MANTLRLLKLREVCFLTSLSKSEIERREENGDFPKRVRLSKHPRGRFGYIENEVMGYIESFIKERNREHS